MQDDPRKELLDDIAEQEAMDEYGDDEDELVDDGDDDDDAVADEGDEGDDDGERDA